jgi:hypothetical protein
MPEIQGVKGEAIVSYAELLTTRELGYHRLVRLWRAFPEGEQNEEKERKPYFTHRRDVRTLA